ncbi:MAG: hypothetical protein RLZZ450_962 [Pseudomonadota bacterium]|jgi:uncharacterized protein YhaN
MRFDRLSLTAYGPFTERTLDFSGRPHAVQLVYGPNEAGKSSTLRAVLGLLYGIHARTGDAHTHEHTKLRIGATLVDRAGNAQRFVRRKGNKNTLEDGDGNLLAESAIAGMLGGLNQDLFTQMFGLDHVRLREGAEALLRGGGQLGEVLFDASLGGRGIHTLIESLRAEADALYKQRGRTPELNAALESLREKKKLRTDAMLSPQAFVDQQAALATAIAERRELSETRQRLAAEKSRLTRLLSLLPLIARRDGVSAELAKLAGSAADDEPSTHDDDALEETVRELNRRYGSVLSAEREEPRCRAELATLERDVEALRGRLGSGVQGLALLGTGEVDTARRTRLRKLVERERSLQRERAELVRLDAASEHEQARLTARLADYPARTDGPLGSLVADIERDDLLGQLVRGAAELAKVGAQLDRRAAQLTGQVDLTRLDLSSLSHRTLPSDATVSEYEVAYESSARELLKLTHAYEQTRDELSRLERARGELLAFGELATRAELDQARASRDGAFDALFSEPTPKPALLRAYSAALQHADELADRLTREAQQAAELRRVDQRLAELSTTRAELAERTASEQRAAREVDERFQACVAPLGLRNLTPRSARPLLAELAALRALSVQRDELAQHVALLVARAHERSRQLHVQLGGELAPVDCAASARSELERLLGLARQQVSLALELARERAALSAQLDKLLSERTTQHGRLQVVTDELQATHESYARELAAFGLVGELSPDELLACLDDLSQLGQRTRELATLRARLSAAQVDREALVVAVREAVSRFLESQPSAPGEPSFALEAALADLSRVLRERSEAKRDRVRLRAEQLRLDEQLTGLGDGVPLDELRVAVRAFEPHEGRARVEELERQLEEHGHKSSDLEQSIGRLSLGLERLEQVSGAVELAEDYEQELSRARALSRRYVELKLALSLLSSEVERYRTQHQQPVLKRASELFPRLTLNRYKGLSVEYDEQDEPVLSCLLHGGRSVRVGGLSDGTRDQLYLALRVASIERYFEGRPPLPLILDDALVHFDDLRATAALEVLGELAKHTQVLFFTHHARMIDLARNALGERQLCVHELAPRLTSRSNGPLFDTTLS